MKGIVFTEFLELVEEKFGYNVVDKVISESDLESKGIYTSIGTYDSAEMYAMLKTLNEISEIPIPQLLNVFGHHLHNTFTKKYHTFFQPFNHAFDFLKTLHDHIHVEVKKLYPDAELPDFEYERVSDKKLIMIYSSSRSMSDLAVGLLEACLEYYKHEYTITSESLNPEATVVKFNIEVQ